MKRPFHLLLVALLFAVVGCNDETVEKADQNQINFQALLGKQTRATETTVTSLQTASATTAIPVEAYKAEDNSPWNTFNLVYGTNWTHSTPVYAPTFALNYYSWYPTAIVDDTFENNDGEVTFEYTVATTAAAQEDLIVASALNQTVATIPLTFSHILSQVNFAIQGVAGIKVEITNISLNKIASTSTFTYPATWATPTGQANYAYDPVGTTNKTDGVATTIQHMGNKGGTEQTDNNNANALMLMPQTFGDDTSTFTFDFSLTNIDNEALASGTGTGVLEELDVTTWLPGKRYLYVIDFTGYLVNKLINFTVAVAPWEDGDPTTPVKPTPLP